MMEPKEVDESKIILAKMLVPEEQKETS